jgi:predicted GNAT family acetyltransferase
LSAAVTRWRVETGDDAALTLGRAGAFLRSSPVHHNLVLSLLQERSIHPEPGRYWTVLDGDEVVGVAFQSPLSFHAAITTMPPEALPALVDAMALIASDLPGVFGEAGISARFAGHWAETLKVPTAPVEGQRLYRLGSLVAPTDVPGRLRMADDGDQDLVLSWLEDFRDETGGHPPPVHVVARRIAAGFVALWGHDRPVSMAYFTPPAAGVSRIGPVYTPPPQRRRGFAAACTAATSDVALRSGADDCVLYTQLTNPQSNAIYRRIGYRAVSEQLRYAFSR